MIKTTLFFGVVCLGTIAGQCAEPPVEILRPNASDRLQPGSTFRFEWRVLGTNFLDRGDWNFYFETNGVLVGRIHPESVYDGEGKWHAEVTVPERVSGPGPLGEVLVDLPTGCNYTLHLHEDVAEADGRSAVFCVGVPVLNVRVSQVEVCWNARSNRSYQVQFRSTATSNLWNNLGVPVTGSGATNCLTDVVVPGQPQRFYRVQELP